MNTLVCFVGRVLSGAYLRSLDSRWASLHSFLFFFAPGLLVVSVFCNSFGVRIVRVPNNLALR